LSEIALFADTIIASFLVAGSLSALYYADRINQLPIGVIGIAAGTVLLPEMARRIAAGDEKGARHAQGRATDLTLCSGALYRDCDRDPRSARHARAFMRTSVTDATAAAATLAAYATGFCRSCWDAAVARLRARGDTWTPVVLAALMRCW
jgi:putative peptidoglycan lipid II flippase